MSGRVTVANSRASRADEEQGAGKRLQPIYLLADSQLLFWKRKGRSLLDTVRATLSDSSCVAAYIGASNNDEPQFADLFQAAMDAAGIRERRIIYSSFPSQDREFLARATVVLLAGGDVEAGWKVFVDTGMKDLIVSRYLDGAALIGVSAGAVQLGCHAVLERGENSNEILDTFNLVPLLVDVHDEGRQWNKLVSTIRLLDGSRPGVGIPRGGGMIFHSDCTIEALRFPVHEFSKTPTDVRSALVWPQTSD
jgi:cyanophycinase